MSLGDEIAVTCAGSAETACATCAGDLVSASGFDSVITASGTESSTTSDLISATEDAAGSSGASGQVSGPFA